MSGIRIISWLFHKYLKRRCDIRRSEIGPWMLFTSGKVQIIERDFQGGRWYRSLPERECTVYSKGMLAFKRHSFFAVAIFPTFYQFGF